MAVRAMAYLGLLYQDLIRAGHRRPARPRAGKPGGPRAKTARRAFTVWLKRVLLTGRMPGVDFNKLNELHEVRSMLAERVVEWTEEWKK